MSLVQRQRRCDGRTYRAETVEQRVDGSWRNEDAVVQQLERPVYTAQTDNPVPGHASTCTPIFDEWQKIWNCCTENKLHAIKPTVGGYKQKTCLSRGDSVLLNRLRIGRTRLTHFYLLSSDDDIPERGSCQCPLTVKHILMECVDFNDVRNKHFVASSVKDLFDNVEAHSMRI